MCNLYTIRAAPNQIAERFGAAQPAFSFDGGDIYPKYQAPVVRSGEQGRVVEMMSWGFPPPAASRAPVTNVRNLASPFWKSALARPDRRCLVPVTRFCEWEGEKGAKVKRWFDMPSEQIFAFAGVWRPTETGPAFAFLTCEPNAVIAPIHPKAMPVILHREDEERWLTIDYTAACALAQPFPSQLMGVS